MIVYELLLHLALDGTGNARGMYTVQWDYCSVLIPAQPGVGTLPPPQGPTSLSWVAGRTDDSVGSRTGSEVMGGLIED